MKPLQAVRALRIRDAAAASFLAMSVLAACPAVAADLGEVIEPAPAEPVVANEWSVIVSPYVWAESLTGTGMLRDREVDVDARFRDILKDLDIAFMGAVEITNGTFGAFFNAEYADVGDNDVLSLTFPSLGEVTFGARTTNTMVSGGFYYRVFSTELGGNTSFGTPRVLSVSPLVGLRWNRLHAELTAQTDGGLERDISASEAWLDPFVGARVDADLSPRWNLMLEADVGGFDIGSKVALNGQAYLGYRTHLFGRESLLRVGYRARYQDYSTGGFNWDVTQHGPVVGASVKF
jgi:hypothetical protein